MKPNPISSRSAEVPAEAAAFLLSRMGLAILFAAFPCAGIFWRSAAYVLLPVGAVLMATAALLEAPHYAGRSFRQILGLPVALAALSLAFWAGLSLLWTPFPAEAGERLLQFSIAAFLTALAAFYLPHRMRTADLYLLPAGIGLASAAALVLAYLDPAWFSGSFAYDESLFERTMTAIIVLVWPALGLLSLREHWIAASLLAILVAGVALAGLSQTALFAMGAGALTFALAMSAPGKIARYLGFGAAALVVIAPLLPLVFRMAPGLFGGGPEDAPVHLWGELILSQWPRLITGHGFNFVHSALNTGYLPAGMPRSLLFIVWHDLGLLGAAGLAALIILVCRTAGQAPADAAPALLAGIAAVLSIAFLGLATVQIWWLMLLDCEVIAFALLVKAADKAKRPGVQAIRATRSASARTPKHAMSGSAASQ